MNVARRDANAECRDLTTYHTYIYRYARNVVNVVGVFGASHRSAAAAAVPGSSSSSMLIMFFLTIAASLQC